MILAKLREIKQEFLSFSKAEKYFVLAVMLCGCCINAEYAIIRPVSNSLFLFFHTTQLFPYAWLATVPLNFLIVGLYNRYLPRFGCFRLFLFTVALVIATSTCGAFFLEGSPVFSFLFYVWKEVYILLMFQHLWSLIQASISAKRAKYLYGILYGVGGIGAALGSLIPGFLAVKMGSESLLFLSPPLYLLLTLFFFLAIKNSQIHGTTQLPQQNASFFHGVKLIASSRVLVLILVLVGLMQFVSTVIDYQFNTVLETHIPGKDLRTEFFGRVMGIVHFVTISMQFVGTFLVVHFLGLRGSHLLIPCVLAVNALGFILFPAFGMASLSYITVKGCDFSLFGLIKEMLYTPLKVEEKFQAKSVIDVFAYRTSKALASFLILFFQAFAGAYLLSFLSWGCLFLLATWGLLVVRLLKTPDSHAKTI